MTFSDYLPYYKRNLKVAFPVMLTQIGAALVGLFDSIMVGHYHTADLAAVSFSNAIFFSVMVFAMGALMGITPLIGYEVGRNAKDSTIHIHHWYNTGTLFALLLSVCTIVILSLFYPLMTYMGQEEIVVETARPYFTLITVSILPFLFFSLQRQFLEGLGNTFVAMAITLGTNLLNIALNWVFIFGHFGLPAMGAMGAGIATLISRLLMPACMAVAIYAKPEWRQYLTTKEDLKDAQLYRQRVSVIITTRLRMLWHTGAPIGMQTFLETITFTLSFIIVGWISKEALAAHHIANQIADLTFMLALGIGAATTIRVSHQLGKGDLHALRMAANASIHLVLIMNTIGAGMMISLRHYIPLIFTQDPAVIQIASQLILFAGLFQYADGLQAVGAAMLRGIQDVKRPMQYAFVAYILVALPIGLICMFMLKMGAAGIWVGFIAGLSVAAALFHTRFHHLYADLINHPNT